MDPSKEIDVVFGSPENWRSSKYPIKEVSEKERADFRGERDRCFNDLAQENLKKGGLKLYGWEKRKDEYYDLCNKKII